MAEKDQSNINSSVGLSCNFHGEVGFYFIQIHGCVQVVVNLF